MNTAGDQGKASIPSGIMSGLAFLTTEEELKKLQQDTESAEVDLQEKIEFARQNEEDFSDEEAQLIDVPSIEYEPPSIAPKSNGELIPGGALPDPDALYKVVMEKKKNEPVNNENSLSHSASSIQHSSTQPQGMEKIIFGPPPYPSVQD